MKPTPDSEPSLLESALYAVTYALKKGPPRCRAALFASSFGDNSRLRPASLYDVSYRADGAAGTSCGQSATSRSAAPDGMTHIHSELALAFGGWSAMQTRTQYRDFVEECDRL